MQVEEIPTEDDDAQNDTQSQGDDTDDTQNESQGDDTVTENTQSQSQPGDPSSQPSQQPVNNYQEVERILSSKRYRGQTYYRVKWKNHTQSEWILERDVSPHLVREFHLTRTADGRKRKGRRGRQASCLQRKT